MISSACGNPDASYFGEDMRNCRRKEESMKLSSLIEK